MRAHIEPRVHIVDDDEANAYLVQGEEAIREALLDGGHDETTEGPWDLVVSCHGGELRGRPRRGQYWLGVVRLPGTVITNPPSVGVVDKHGKSFVGFSVDWTDSAGDDRSQTVQVCLSSAWTSNAS